MTTATCPVTVWNPRLAGAQFELSVRPCGQPLVGRLCAHHEAERVRLGGAS